MSRRSSTSTRSIRSFSTSLTSSARTDRSAAGRSCVLEVPAGRRPALLTRSVLVPPQADSLPMRWIWIDKFLEFRSGKFARAVKNLTLAEEHLHDHLPGYPVMPASLIIEGLAQTGGILVGEADGFAQKVVLAKIPR